MPANTGFLVKNDRFSLTEPDLYLLTGWLAPNTEVTAFLNGTKLPVMLEPLSEMPDERFGGCETKLTISFASVEIPERGHLKLYAEGAEGRHLSFSVPLAQLLEKKRSIHYFIDDFSVLREDGLVRIQGWAAAREKVTVDVYGHDGKKLLPSVERYKRYDTAELFSEYPIDPECGFHVELRPIPDGPVRVRMRTSEEEIVLIYPTDRLRVAAKQSGRLLGKARDAFLYNGIGAVWSKTYNKLFNPAMHMIEYGQWIKKHLPSERELRKQREQQPEYAPLVSILIPCYKTPEKYLREMTDSVLAQTYQNWELILSDGSGADSPISSLLDELAASDSRIRVLHNGRQLRIAENTNAALEAASGEWIAFADHDDLLVPSALYECIRAVNENRDAELLYTDEDKIGTGDKFMQPNLKPDYDPDFLTSVNYICHLLVVKKDLVDRVGELDPAFDGAQDHDFILRCTEHTKPEQIVHIPKILYHWRFFEGSTSANPEAKLYAFETGVRAVQSHYDRLGWPASAEKGEYPGLYRTSWHWDSKPLVSVLIPNKDHLADLKLCISSLLEKTSYENLEIIIIENNSEEQETFDGYEELKASDPRIRVITYKGGFNYSAINNFGTREAKGEYYLFLNNDTESISDVISEMLGYAMRPGTGAVGARLYYDDQSIQHAGCIMGWGGVAGHAFVNQKRGVTGYQHRIICQQDLSAVTAACMMVPAEVFRRIGGFTEELAVAFNDIDLCMKIRAEQLLIVYNPFAEMFHYESKSRGLENTPEKQSRFSKEIALFKERWPEILRDGDPYYNPNLSMITQDFSLRRL
ncbi:MAG: glycosyltransferase family 2 protein [Lachnospiraceae bacterium]|nr:glycosyltransferase family 2 protein [Lachnospiraceae bacterium]